MKQNKTLCIKLSLICIVVAFTQCATNQKMNTKVPTEIKNSYFETWKTETASGFTLYIPVEESSTMTLQTAYFKQKKIVLKNEDNTAIYVGKYTFPKAKRDLIMSEDPKKEFGNTLPGGIEKIPYSLKDNQCVVEYVKDGVKGHFRIENVTEQQE